LIYQLLPCSGSTGWFCCSVVAFCRSVSLLGAESLVLAFAYGLAVHGSLWFPCCSVADAGAMPI